MKRAHWFMLRGALYLMFKGVLPLAARLPMRWGMGIASGLGRFCYWLDLDWRTVALRTHFVKSRTRQAVDEILGEASDADAQALVLQRFINASREELEGHWLARGRAQECRYELEGLAPVLAALEKGKGLVLFTMHFDAVLMGVAQLGMQGMRLNLMTSNVVEDPRVAPFITRYFQNKYAGIDTHLNGGHSLHVESKLKSMYDALKRGEGLAILGEAPAGQLDDAINLHFLGKRRAFAPGAFRMAERTRSAMVAFVCRRVAVGHYKISFSPVCAYDAALGHGANAQAMVQFMGEQIRQAPGCWWAADQLPNFITIDS